MATRNCFVLVWVLTCMSVFSVGCSNDKPQTIELTDDAIKMYDDYDKETQKNSGAKYGE